MSIVTFSMVIGFAVAAITVLRHERFLSGAYDMGFYIHDVWMLGRGEWFSTIFGFHIFADHFSPVMLLLAPFSWIGSTGVWLLVIQAVAIGSGVLAAFRIGRAIGNARLGWLSAVWFASSAAVWHAVMFDFRPVTLGVVTMLWLVAALEEEWRTSGVIAIALLAASTREDVAVLAGAILVIHGILRQRRRSVLLPLGGMIASVGLAYSLGASQLFAPFDYFLWYRYADYGASPLEALADPGFLVPTALSRLLRLNPLAAFAALLAPFLVIPVFAGWRRTWPGLLIMVANGVSAHPAIPTIYYQYYLAVIVFFVWGGSYAFRKGRWAKRRMTSVVLAVAVFLGLGPVVHVQFGLEERFVSGVIAENERSVLHDLVEKVPDSASVSAGHFLLPHVAERREVYPFPGPMVCSGSLIFYTPEVIYPEYVLVEVGEPELYGIDLRELGFIEVTQVQTGELWRSSGKHPDGEACPTPVETRELQFQYVRDEASR